MSTFETITMSYLGRLILIAFIIMFASLNKTWGLVAILCLVIAYQYYERSLGWIPYEGFENNTDGTANSNATAVVKATLLKKQREQSASTDASGNTANATTSSATATEGFCLTDKESTIQKGKQSNKINVKKRFSSDNPLEPSNPTLFKDLYASF